MRFESWRSGGSIFARAARGSKPNGKQSLVLTPLQPRFAVDDAHSIILSRKSKKVLCTSSIRDAASRRLR